MVLLRVTIRSRIATIMLHSKPRQNRGQSPAEDRASLRRNANEGPKPPLSRILQDHVRGFSAIIRMTPRRPRRTDASIATMRALRKSAGIRMQEGERYC